eukprot:scaffold130763_cov23-Tisochrysis_lutea.AAC.2
MQKTIVRWEIQMQVSHALVFRGAVRLRAAFWVGPGGVADEGAGEAALYEPDEAQAKALGVG